MVYIPLIVICLRYILLEVLHYSVSLRIWKITRSFSISIIKFFAPVCFGVYLIHDNMSIDHFFLGGKFTFLAQMDPISLVIGAILIGLGIFVACSLIDWIRELIFRKLKVKSRFAKLEENIYLKFDSYLN